MSAPASTPIPPNPNDRRRRLGLVALLLVVVAGLVAAAGLVLVNRGETVAVANYTLSETPQAQPVFEPRGARGDDPFFPLETQVNQFRIGLEASTGTLNDAAVDALAESVKTGLYGGTEENTCDPERLISFLYANPDLGEAWAGVQGIEFNEIAAYVRSLEVRVLAEPTNVLNHGFDPVTGGAYEIDAILDAGTAVLVDSDGDVRTRCYCGNPIKPKPPQHRPPRCIVFGAQVFTVPGGTTRTDDTPTDVVLTGQQARVASGTWTEVSWGESADESGWVQSINLRNHHCAPAYDSGMCPGPGIVETYADPDTSNQVGELNGTINGADASTDITAPISRVGGPTGVVVENGFVLIRFVQPSPSLQNSAWVQVNQLNESDCAPIARCVNTEGAAKQRAGGLEVRPSGVYKVEFTGHFTADSGSAEVRFLDGGTVGWITNFYTPLPWSDCEQDPTIDPVVKCVRDARGTENVWPDATTTDLTQMVGNIKAAPVTLVGDLTPTNGRVEIQMGPGGPIGWIDATRLDGNPKYCQPREVCVGTAGPAWSDYKNAGTQLAGTPSGPSPIRVWYSLAFDVSTTPVQAHYLVEVNGQTGWLDIKDFVVPPDQTCEDPVAAECPATIGGTFDDDAVAKAGGAANEGDLVVVDAIEQARRAASLDVGGACCLSKAVFDSDAADNEQAVNGAVIVALTGTSNAAGTWLEIATVYPGKWAPAVNFVDASACATDVTTPPDACDGSIPGAATVLEGVCCVASKVLNADGGSLGIDPPQFAEYVGSVSNFGDFIYEMRLLPDGITIFAPPESLISTGECSGGEEPVECPVIDGETSAVPTNAIRTVACCADTNSDGITTVTLEGTVDVGDGTDPSVFEYLTTDHGWRPAEVFVAASNCTNDGDAAADPIVEAQPDDPAEEDSEPEPSEPSGQCENDTDGDGVCDSDDNCRLTANADQRDTFGDQRGDACEEREQGDACDGDADGDGVCDADDNCPRVSNPNQENSDGTTDGDACQPVDPCASAGDQDGDGICNPDDNCPRLVNPGQENTYGGPDGDVCEDPDACEGADKDGDGVCDNTDNCIGVSNSSQADTYGDKRGDACEDLCPQERLAGSDCCKEGTVADDEKCYEPCPNGQGLDYNADGCETQCPNGDSVAQGKECAPECPLDRQNPSTDTCCKEGTEHFHGACYVMCGVDLPDLGNGCGPCRARGGDTDIDKICGRDDNCANDFNPNQTDKDEDGIGDACDPV